MLKVMAPAKINLTLEVLGKRRDGFHEISSIAQTVSLYDTLEFQPGGDLKFYSRDPAWVSGKSLVTRAVRLLRETVGGRQGATISLDKRIPLLSGLGGDSSDAAATLRGLNQFWGLGLPREKLVTLARQLGSDVAFFLYGGTARLGGRGEAVAQLANPPGCWVVLLMPEVARPVGKTARLYAEVTQAHYTDGGITERAANRLSAGQGLMDIGLYNVFEGIARKYFTGLEDFFEKFRRAGAAEVHLAGSGPGLFALFDSEREAAACQQTLKQQQQEAYLVRTLL